MSTQVRHQRKRYTVTYYTSFAHHFKRCTIYVEGRKMFAPYLEKARFACAAAVLTLTGCAVIVPNTVIPEFQHISHISEHQPFTNDPCHYGTNTANLVAHWDIAKHIKFELVEGVSLDRHWTDTHEAGYGAMLGPREESAIRIGYAFTTRAQ